MTWNESSNTANFSAFSLVNDANASIESLLSAIADSSLGPHIRDALILHPRLGNGALLDLLQRLPTALQDRIVAATDDRLVIHRWALSPVAFNRCVAAMNPSCPAEWVIQLASDMHPAVRSNAACNPSMPTSVRVALATRDENPSVREFAHWLLTTAAGRNLAAGQRYAPDSSSELGDEVRIVAYGISRNMSVPI